MAVNVGDQFEIFILTVAETRNLRLFWFISIVFMSAVFFTPTN